MTKKQIELSEFMAVPVADGLDAVDEALALFRDATGQKKESARRILGALKLMFDKLAPATLSKRRWADLEAAVLKTVPH